MFLETSENSQEKTCARVSFSIKLEADRCIFIYKETLAQVFSYEFCENFKNTSGAQPELFQGRGGFVKLGHFDKHFIKKSRKKAQQGKTL